jgi:adenosylmethionine-8-amino-7-oxononanoate aminotransferase
MNRPDRLWLHFVGPGPGLPGAPGAPMIVRGEGAYVFDEDGKRYLDGLAGLFVTQVGHGRPELAEAAARQARELAYFPIWGNAHPRAVELAERLAALAPGDLERVFFTSGGSEAVESAWKLARQYFRLTGQPGRTKVISRSLAYHGTTMGALSITGLPALKAAFEPLVPGAVRVPNTNPYRPPATDPAEAIATAIEMEGPDTVAAVFLEPVQNSGGCLPPPDGYFQRVREICDRSGVLLVSDEVICAFGRLGEWFGAERYAYQPDVVTFAKGLTSGYAPMGGMLVSDRLARAFLDAGTPFAHGFTYGGHPVCAAVALANLDLMESEGLLAHVRAHEKAFRAALERLLDLPIVGDVRGAGYFLALELVKDTAAREPFPAEEAKRVKGVLAPALADAGLLCRVDDRGDLVVQLSPPLIIGPPEFDFIENVLRRTLTDTWQRL